MENLELSGGDTLHNDTTANEEAKAATSAVVAKLHEVMARLPWGGEYSVKPPVVIGYEVPSELPCISQVQQFHTDFPENGPLSIFIGMQQKVRHLGVASIGGLPAVFAMHRNDNNDNDGPKQQHADNGANMDDDNDGILDDDHGAKDPPLTRPLRKRKTDNKSTKAGKRCR